MDDPTRIVPSDTTKTADPQPNGGPAPQTVVFNNNPAAKNPALPAANVGTGDRQLSIDPAHYLSDKLKDAELLLSYAAEVGIAVDDKTRAAILLARAECDNSSISRQTAADLLSALTSLAATVKPVTVASLKAKPERARSDIRFYGIAAMWIAGIIVCFSLCTFASSLVSDQIGKDIETANTLVSRLRVELGPAPVQDAKTVSPAAAVANSDPSPPSPDMVWFGTNGLPSGVTAKDVISDLQQFAATMREIQGYSGQLKYFVLDFKEAPYLREWATQNPNGRTLELTPGLDRRLSQELTDRVAEYQNVRNFGNLVREKVAVYYGGLATCVLPVLYALLGAGAYLLRLYEDQVNNRTFTGGDRHVARFLIAGICGLVVGLFNKAVVSSPTIPLFGIAFLAGYAVDVFFNFLEGLLQMFRRAPATTTPQK